MHKVQNLYAQGGLNCTNCTFFALTLDKLCFHFLLRKEMRLRVVCCVYLKTHFAFDFSLVLCDWLSLIIWPGITQSVGSPEFLRLLRISKAARLFRVLSVLVMECSLLKRLPP